MRSTAAGIEPYEEEHRAQAGTRAVDRSRNGCIMAAFVPLGRVVATRGALNVFLTAGQDTDELLDRPQSGDWGEESPEDAIAHQCGPCIPPNRSASAVRTA
jgi:hypothetical protein